MKPVLEVLILALFLHVNTDPTTTKVRELGNGLYDFWRVW